MHTPDTDHQDREQDMPDRTSPGAEPVPEDQPGRPGAEGGSTSSDATALPSHPSDSDSAWGDTDQHSTG
jgi:hypothetical protein